MIEATVKPEFIVNRQGRDFVLYAGLLDAAKRAGLRSLTVEILQFPSPENNSTTVARATAILVDADGAEHTHADIGDASPENVGRAIAAHAVRMASTRAKARALRDAINVGTVAVEELADDEDAGPRRAAPEAARQQAPAPRRAEPAARPASDAPATREQRDRLAKLLKALGRPLEIPASLTSEQAATNIMALVKEFNAQTRKA